MKKLFTIGVSFMLFVISTSINANLPGVPNALPGSEILKGDERTACEVIICMSSSKRPSECNEPLAIYFGIKAKKPSDTIKKRRDYLKLCPSSNANSGMDSLTEAIARQEMRCDANSLNNIIDQRSGGGSCKDGGCGIEFKRTTASMPGYCDLLINHEYTVIDKPKYVCNGEWYSVQDWNRGYKYIYNSNGDVVGQTPVKRTCWVD
ncbi:TrbM/KikA/MpfK family conjugal transfer protein [Zophobihabitans entericus]|uniref:Conjugal transfer protein TrbM n=1 Tax=Zophobihabitans entericus TaxID=1635327 RepID=A0A6G9IFL6_9GAMM|nr:TrbM/KikA/MpfK family conjugal transfer protein [Zophobihabitans entericus]QIQ22514.1 hypothetical protein IPMB12_11950 [Zophobihabitans entericus]